MNSLTVKYLRSIRNPQVTIINSLGDIILPVSYIAAIALFQYSFISDALSSGEVKPNAEYPAYDYLTLFVALTTLVAVFRMRQHSDSVDYFNREADKHFREHQQTLITPPEIERAHRRMVQRLLFTWGVTAIVTILNVIIIAVVRICTIAG